MKKLVIGTIILFLAILGVQQSVSAYSINIDSKTPTEVKCGETFEVIVNLDQSTPLANGHIKYDTTLFQFMKTTQENMSAQAYVGEGYVSYMYTDTFSGVKSLSFTFKAKQTGTVKTGKFELTDTVCITEDDVTYEGADIQGKKSINITVNPNATGSSSSKNNTTKNSISSSKSKGTKDNTTSKDSKLPQTGEGMLLIYALIAVVILAVILKIKSNSMNKLFK